MPPVRSMMIDVPDRAQSARVPEGTRRYRLEARLRGEGPCAIVAPPHPLYGGTIGNPVVRALEQALAEAGFATLAFNFRGTGESDGEPSADLDEARIDYLAAASAAPTATLFSGYSFGSVAALAAALERGVSHVVMVAPPLGLLDTSLLARYPGQLSVIIGDQDEYTPVNAVEDFFVARANTRVELLHGNDHFFLGGAVQELSAGLRRLLAP